MPWTNIGNIVQIFSLMCLSSLWIEIKSWTRWLICLAACGFECTDCFRNDTSILIVCKRNENVTNLWVLEQIVANCHSLFLSWLICHAVEPTWRTCSTMCYVVLNLTWAKFWSVFLLTKTYTPLQRHPKLFTCVIRCGNMKSMATQPIKSVMAAVKTQTVAGGGRAPVSIRHW